MAIKVSQAFQRTSANPVDETMALTKAQMLTVNDNLMPDYYFTICQDDGQIYLYDKTATPSATTGKFTKFEGGGGGGGGTSEGIVITKTLLASGWNTNNQQTLTFTGYETSMGGVIGIPTNATTAQKDAYAEAVINVVAQSGNQFTFECENVPAIDLSVTLYAGGSGSGSGSSLPDGGTTGQVLKKQSNDDGDADWEDDNTGHTVLDNDGTEMAEEPSLQFKGLNVTDNSVDEVTEVESIGLNKDSMDDILNASIPGNQVASNGLVYSTEEQVVGKWIDGKPLYQKTVQIPVSAFEDAVPDSTGYCVPKALHNISNLGIVVNLFGQAYGNVVRPLPFSYGMNAPDFKFFASLEANNTYVFLECGTEFRQSTITANTYGAYVTIQYTKTTD